MQLPDSPSLLTPQLPNYLDGASCVSFTPVDTHTKNLLQPADLYLSETKRRKRNNPMYSESKVLETSRDSTISVTKGIKMPQINEPLRIKSRSPRKLMGYRDSPQSFGGKNQSSPRFAGAKTSKKSRPQSMSGTRRAYNKSAAPIEYFQPPTLGQVSLFRVDSFRQLINEQKRALSTQGYFRSSSLYAGKRPLSPGKLSHAVNPDQLIS